MGIYEDDWTPSLDARRRREELLKKKEQEERRPTKKFYVGQRPDRMTPGWNKATLQEAVDHAKRLCEQDGKIHYVVQIVRVVRPKAQPIVVEKV